MGGFGAAADRGPSGATAARERQTYARPAVAIVPGPATLALKKSRRGVEPFVPLAHTWFRTVGSNQISDEDLLARLHAGDTAAFDTLFSRYERRLYGYVRRMVGEDAVADDLFQDVMCKVLCDRSFDPARGRFSAWLFGVARNRCLMHRRSDAVRRDPAKVARAASDLVVDGHENVVVMASHVESAMSSLPEPQRQLLILKQVGELTYREIAGMLGEAEGTIKSRLFAATQAFRRRLAELGEPS